MNKKTYVYVSIAVALGGYLVVQNSQLKNKVQELADSQSKIRLEGVDSTPSNKPEPQATVVPLGEKESTDSKPPKLTSEEASVSSIPSHESPGYPMTEAMKKGMDQALMNVVEMQFKDILHDLGLGPTVEQEFKQQLVQRAKAEQTFSALLVDASVSVEETLKLQNQAKNEFEAGVKKILPPQAWEHFAEYSHKLQKNQQANMVHTLLENTNLDPIKRDLVIDEFRSWLEERPSTYPAFGEYTSDSIKHIRDFYEGTMPGERKFTEKAIEIMEKETNEQLQWMEQHLPKEVFVAYKEQLEMPIKMMRNTLPKQE